MKPRLVVEKQTSGLWKRKIDTPLPTVVIIPVTSGVANWDFSKSQTGVLNLEANTTLSIKGIKDGDVGIIMLGPAGFTLTLPGTSLIPDGTPVPAIAGLYILSFLYTDGTYLWNISAEYVPA